MDHSANDAARGTIRWNISHIVFRHRAVSSMSSFLRPYTAMFSKPVNAKADAVIPESLLTPENCQSPTRIRAFLRLSRFATDDTIREHMNDSKTNCNTYFTNKIVPQWKARSSLIEYCSDYGLELQQKTHLDKIVLEGDGSPSDHPQFDLTLDPYATKDYVQKLENQSVKSTEIRNWTQNELEVESIVRDLTIGVLNDKCQFKDWMQEFQKALKLTPPPRNI